MNIHRATGLVSGARKWTTDLDKAGMACRILGGPIGDVSWSDADSNQIPPCSC